MPHTIEQQIKATYFALRIGAAVIAFVFPLLLWGGGKLAGFTLRDSMSAYYWATPDQLCACAGSQGPSCQTKGSEAVVALSTPGAKTFQPGLLVREDQRDVRPRHQEGNGCKPRTSGCVISHDS